MPLGLFGFGSRTSRTSDSCPPNESYPSNESLLSLSNGSLRPNGSRRTGGELPVVGEGDLFPARALDIGEGAIEDVAGVGES